MIAFACETRLSETTFVQSSSTPEADYRNRIFSMAGELPFAGHPSLGTAVAVARVRGMGGTVTFRQQTLAGVQPVEVEIDGNRARASMLQEPADFGPEVDPQPALTALGLRPDDMHPGLPAQVVSTGLGHLMLPLAGPEALGRIVADPAAVDAVIDAIGAYGIYAAWFDSRRGQARTREFARSTQVAEDPATGSAAGPLCAYLNRYAGCERLEILQGVELGRPGRIEAEIAGDRVRVGGEVVVVIDGTVML